MHPWPERALRRSEPKAGAQCVSSARWDLCGGPPERAVPTAIVLVLVVPALILATCTGFEAVTPTTHSGIPRTAPPLPAVDLSATLAGWVPVAYGDAEVSVPATWAVMTHAWCGGKWPPIIQLGVVRQDLGCPTAASSPTVRITPLGSIPTPYRQEKPVLLHGIFVLLGPRAATFVTYFVPSLHVELWATDGSGTRVTDTLAVSPRAVVLATRPAPEVPSGWRSVTFAGLHFSVPAGWPVNRTQVTPGLGAICRTPGVAFSGTTVTLSTDACPMLLPPCAYLLPLPQEPVNGVQVDSGLRTEPMVTLAFPARCLDLHGLAACPATLPPYSILVLRVTVPGRTKPVFVSVGLAGNGMIARTIVYSLRGGVMRPIRHPIAMFVVAVLRPRPAPLARCHTPIATVT